jgi:hypothetical protein
MALFKIRFRQADLEAAEIFGEHHKDVACPYFYRTQAEQQ